MRWVGHVAHIGERRGIYRVLVEKTEGKRPLRRPRCRLGYNIKMFRKWDLEVRSGLNWLRIEAVGGHL
jgi:hypothetical protein